jgi:hypothetical protein
LVGVKLNDLEIGHVLAGLRAAGWSVRMGTNFYWKDRPNDADKMDPRYHIGKRSAAGLWCWNCNTTLCKGGVDHIHDNRSSFYDACPRCGAKPRVEDRIPTACGVELGFTKPRERKPSGVHSCASFAWAQDAESVRLRCMDSGDRKVIVDEYGREMTGREFLEMLEANCPVQFNAVDEWFD